jgi:hypothetical protein
MEQCNWLHDKVWLTDIIRINKRSENEVDGVCVTHVIDEKFTKNLIRTSGRKRPYEIPWHQRRDNFAMYVWRC